MLGKAPVAAGARRDCQFKSGPTGGYEQSCGTHVPRDGKLTSRMQKKSRALGPAFLQLCGDT